MAIRSIWVGFWQLNGELRLDHLLISNFLTVSGFLLIEAMDFREWCENESVRLTGSKGMTCCLLHVLGFCEHNIACLRIGLVIIKMH